MGELMRMSQKLAGAYYTPDPIARSLLMWGIRDRRDRLLDPSCGDGQFVSGHPNTVGVELDIQAAATAAARAPLATIRIADFFEWATDRLDRFDCTAGNPPFIRYQSFKGAQRARALSLCATLGVRFTGLTSSWAPFLVAAASLLKKGGRMAFVVPAEIGHAPYAAPLLTYLAGHFSIVHIVAVREKLFPDLSEDCWLLYADGFGGQTGHFRLTALDRFTAMPSPPNQYSIISVKEWRDTWNQRLRPFLISSDARALYRHMVTRPDTRRFGEIAEISIGYVSGGNDFFHLRPSEAKRLSIPRKFLKPSVRSGRMLSTSRLTTALLDRWIDNDERILLLRLPKTGELPDSVRAYLDSEKGETVRQAYKCRTRDPWYSVPDVRVPHHFLSYMSGLSPSLVSNEASCTCSNAVHSVHLLDRERHAAYLDSWTSDFVRLSCEIEGHPLGGGMLKLEPREAAQIALPSSAGLADVDASTATAALSTLRRWRHYAID